MPILRGDLPRMGLLGSICSELSTKQSSLWGLTNEHIRSQTKAPTSRTNPAGKSYPKGVEQMPPEALSRPLILGYLTSFRDGSLAKEAAEHQTSLLPCVHFTFL